MDSWAPLQFSHIRVSEAQAWASAAYLTSAPGVVKQDVGGGPQGHRCNGWCSPVPGKEGTGS